MPERIIRFSFTFLLVLVIAFNNFVSSACASTSTTEEFHPVASYQGISASAIISSYDASAPAINGALPDDFWKGLWSGFGLSIGGAIGTITACYAVDVLIAPANPPAAAYLATLCPSIGGAVGGVGGLATTKAVVDPI